MKFGKKIKALRKVADLTQAGLAEKAGTTQRAISEIENGKRNPTMDLLLRIMEPLGYELGEIKIDGRKIFPKPEPIEADISKPNPPTIISTDKPIL